MPDVQVVADHIALGGQMDAALYQSPAGPITPLDILYGHIASVESGAVYMAHKTGFTARSLAGHLKASGFSNIKVERKGFDLWAVAYHMHQDDPKREVRATIIDPSIRGRITKPGELPDELDRDPMPVTLPKQAKQASPAG